MGAGMGMDVLAIFKDSPNARSYAAGDVIFNAGDVGHEMYVLLDGAVDIVLDGKRIEELGPGSVFGEMAIVDSVPRSADAVARTDVVVEPIDEEWFKHLIRRSPTFGLHVMSVMAERLRRHMRPPN
ncbi:MAG TPA: cyclic nucleotide-binding domain-containing protein [Trueperaceae bacterium]|nr:cyclic nucleotide-binding domain-containing protein [Trueperaceae bacterium]